MEKEAKKLANLWKAELFLLILMDKVEQSEARLKACQGEGHGTPQSSHAGRYRALEWRKVGTEGD